MSNTQGSSVILQEKAGLISNASTVQIHCIAIKSALTGSLTISGLTTGNALGNTPSDWVLPPTSAGVFTHSGNSKGNASINYALSDAGDAGKVIVAYQNL